MAGPFDGARYQLGEKADKGGKGNEIPGRLQFPAIDVDGIAEGLKGIKADAHGQYEGKRTGLDFYSEEGKSLGKVFQKEVKIFEAAQKAQIDPNADP